MVYIKFNRRNTEITEGREVNLYESDLDLDYKVLSPVTGQLYQVYSNKDLIAEVSFGELFLNGKKLKSNRHNTEIIISENPEVILKVEGFNSYLIDGKKVCSIDLGDGVINWFVNIIRNKKFAPYQSCIEINFDEKQLDPLIALCLVFKEESKRNCSS